jgi:hypothetical protein
MQISWQPFHGDELTSFEPRLPKYRCFTVLIPDRRLTLTAG